MFPATNPTRLAILAAAALTVSSAYGQEDFTWQGGNGAALDWEAPGNWTGGSGFVSAYPGDAAADNANLSVALGGDLSVLIDGKSITLGNLTLGATDGFATTINGGAGITLSASTLSTSGDAGAVNTINVPIVMTSQLEFTAGTSGLTVGSITNSNPAGFRDIRNGSGQALTITGPVVLSDTATAGQLRFRNNNDTSTQVIEGVISDGTAGSGQVSYARGTFHIKGVNTYTGTTNLGENSPNNAATHIIYNDSAFGTGRLNFGGGGAIKTVEGAAGFGTRTLTQEISLQRDARFAGSESVVLTGQIYQSNSRSIINDISGAGKSLTVTGPVFAANSTDDRSFTFTGSGLTNFQGTLDDTTNGEPTVKGSLKVDGTGRVIASNPAMAMYQGNTEVAGGTLQLGTGTTPVPIPDTILSGGGAAPGTIEFNHAGSQDVGAVVNLQLNIKNTGTGTTTLNGTSYASGGTINVDNGKLVLNGANVPAVVIPSATKVSGSTLGVGDNSGIQIGQPVFVSTDNGGGLSLSSTAYVTALLGDDQVILNGGGAAGGTSGVSTNEVTFRMGTATGTSNVIVASGATVGGNGTIGGLLGVNGTVAPGNSVGTMTVMGNAIVNGTYEAEYDASLNTSDLLDVNGTLTLGSVSVLDLQAIGGPADDDAYIIASYGSLSGSFSNVLNLPSGYQVSYAYNGNNIAVVVPEPATLGLLGLGSLLGLRRRRH